MFRYDGAEWTDHKGPRLPDTIFAGFDPIKSETFWTYQVRVQGRPSYWKLSGQWPVATGPGHWFWFVDPYKEGQELPLQLLLEQQF